jgi:hypothetical protein
MRVLIEAVIDDKAAAVWREATGGQDIVTSIARDRRFYLAQAVSVRRLPEPEEVRAYARGVLAWLKTSAGLKARADARVHPSLPVSSGR